MSVWNRLFARSASRLEPKTAPRSRLQLEGLESREVPAIVFVGGWGSSMYQYAFQGTDSADSVPADQFAMNYAKVVYNQPGAPLPASDYLLELDGIKGESRVGDSHIELENVQITSYQLGAHAGVPLVLGASADDRSAGTRDDVVVDGRIITAENFDGSTTAIGGYIRVKKLNSGG